MIDGVWGNLTPTGNQIVCVAKSPDSIYALEPVIYKSTSGFT
jgi:hypothetical protein